MLDEIEYWLKFGVDGFRFDVINFLFHDKELRNNPDKDPKLKVLINELIKILKDANSESPSREERINNRKVLIFSLKKLLFFIIPSSKFISIILISFRLFKSLFS